MTDWRQIAEDCAEGTASKEQQAALDAWVVEQPSHADEYVLWLEVHDQLRATYQEKSIRCRVGVSEFPSTRVGSSDRAVSRSLAALAASSLAVAAGLMLAMWASGLIEVAGVPRVAATVDQADRDLDRSTGEPIEIAATLTGAVDCRWEEGSKPIGYGEQLPSGSVLKLAEGLAQLTYECGAKVVLRGPSELHVGGPSRGVLPRGQITAVVPRRAVGFVVTTPCAEVIDLGTEFAVDVDVSGASQVHVFKGEVVSRRCPAGGAEGPSLHLMTNEAAEYLPGQESVREFPAESGRFVREITPRLRGADLPQAPQVRGLALWLAADLLVKTDAEQRVVAWRDVLCGNNQSPDDALQPVPWSRPVLVPGAMNGVDALRFDGVSSYLVTTPMQTGADQTVFVAVSPDVHQPLAHPGTLLNYNGPPHRDLDSNRMRSEHGVLQLGIGQHQRQPGWQAFVYVGDSARSGAVTGSSFEQEPVVVSYAYNTRNNRAVLRVNGEIEAEASAPASAGATSRRVIGRHGHRSWFFAGEVGEVIIYNRALGKREIQRVSTYLQSKYGTDRGGA